MPDSSSRSHHDPPINDDRLRRQTVGEQEPVFSGITIVDYDPRWPKIYSTAEKRIRASLGDRALRIEHMGSTSVSQLAAKPVIDILLVVADSARELEYAPSLEKAGYRLRVREPEWRQHRMFKASNPEINLHAFSDRCAEIERILLFRDWLRNNESDRALYAQTKRELAQRNWQYLQDYADAKTSVIRVIMTRAAASAEASKLFDTYY